MVSPEDTLGYEAGVRLDIGFLLFGGEFGKGFFLLGIIKIVNPKPSRNKITMLMKG